MVGSGLASRVFVLSISAILLMEKNFGSGLIFSPGQKGKGICLTGSTLHDSFYKSNDLPTLYFTHGVNPEDTGGNFQFIPSYKVGQLGGFLGGQGFRHRSSHSLLGSRPASHTSHPLVP